MIDFGASSVGVGWFGCGMPLPGGGEGGSGRGMGPVSDLKPQLGSRDKKQRLKREDHAYVKHDKCFCDWRVRICRLPTSSEVFVL